ncbi:unnamed protein product [Caenorhabditis auriculariae]|uniref:Eukaryotic membrane protein n=1 Tax=Caenorhabditis auriculariae TaxID=2777116 RepID=A0A8S1HEN8_9PELO|nr:unnamed protein product [Caenorhabditis auriculariae]
MAEAVTNVIRTSSSNNELSRSSSSSSTSRRRVSPPRELAGAPIRCRNESSSTRSIHDELLDLEACDLTSSVNEEISLMLSPSPSPERTPASQDSSATPASVRPSSSRDSGRLSDVFQDPQPRRRATRPLFQQEPEFNFSSDLEESSDFRKPSRISIDERLTVICDSSDNATPLQTPTHDKSPLLDPDPPKSCGFFSFFWNELTRGYSLHNDQARYSEKRRKVYAFMRIPVELEQFLCYGLLQCIDAFCYLFTFLPLRFLMSILGSLLRIKTWTSAETCDVLKVLIIICASFLIREIDSSVLYHQVRSQGVIKLYIFYNMLEVADRLFSSLGQDILDALFWTANEPTRSFWHGAKTIFHLCAAILYATLHTFLVILQATTLNVAFNSHNQALLAIMMSNNFVELKGSVFKKFAKANLFQMACSDVRERIHLIALLFVVMIRNLMAVDWSVESAGEMLPDIMMVIGAELLVDWLKHAFITKFNEINADVYKDFTITIAFDVIRSREQSAFSDYSDQVSRRMGFIPIPLSIMMIRVLSQTFSVENRASLLICFIGWLLLLAIKLCNGIVMLGKACQLVKKYRDFQARIECDEFRKRIVEKKSKSAPNSPRMSLIDFSDVLHQPQGGGKFYTVSDIMNKWDEVQPDMLSERRSTDRGDLRDERTPRRAQSMANMARRDRSEPPPTIAEESGVTSPSEPRHIEEIASSVAGSVHGERTRENSGQCSPKKRVMSSSGGENNEFGDVTAYTMPEQGVQRIE